MGYYSIKNKIGGAHFAVYILAFINPWANRWGAHFGFTFGLTFSAWIYAGGKSYPPPLSFTKKLPTEVIGCLDSNNNTFPIGLFSINKAVAISW